MFIDTYLLHSIFAATSTATKSRKQKPNMFGLKLPTHSYCIKFTAAERHRAVSLQQHGFLVKSWQRTSLLGDAQKRSTYSSVNQPIQPASTIARCSLSVVALLCLSRLASEGIVLIVNAIVDTTMNRTEMIAST